MSRHALAAAALTAAAVILSSPISAASGHRPQRVMLVQKHRFGARNGTFVLYALTPGTLASDSGRFTFMAARKPFIVRKGQRIAIYAAVETLTGKRGGFDLRWRVHFVGAGDGATVGTGTWSLVGGQGVYAGATGSGRLAMVAMTPRGVMTAQLEGLLRAVRT